VYMAMAPCAKLTTPEERYTSTSPRLSAA